MLLLHVQGHARHGHGGFFFDEATCDSFCTALEAHNRIYQELAVLSERDGKKLFLIRPKHHALVELVLDVRRTRRNPLRYSCFEDEDFLQKVKQTGRYGSVEGVAERLCRLFPLHMQLRWDAQSRGQLWE